MRKYNQEVTNEIKPYNILVCDDEQGIIDSLSIFLKKSGYNFYGVTNPYDAIEQVKTGKYDLLILDFIMTPIHGDTVVEKIREFNQELYILLLTGHKDLAPPLETIKRLEIQGYCEKTDRFDQLLLLIESGIKSIEQVRQIKEVNYSLLETNKKLKELQIETIELLVKTIESKDSYTKGHSDRVSSYSVLIGKHLNLDEQSLELLKIGGLFHDIGKIGIKDLILQKEGKLTDEEYDQIKRHPVIGVEILNQSKHFKDIIPIVKHHHERYDGRGYPDGLTGDQIPYLARIASIADSFDAMTSRRSYRDSLDLDIVKEEFRKNLGTQFDPELGSLFLNILENNFDEIEEIKNS